MNFELSSGNQDGRNSLFNDRGQVAFGATFTDGTSGIFVSNAVAVPEPASLMLFAVGATLLRRRCRLLNR
ncbi:MAG: PEP-CTERM sorting domain-containing protein [Pirellulales bacterium]